MKRPLPSFTEFLTVLIISSIGFVSFAAEGGPKFFDDFDKARQASQQSGKTMIAIFSAKWCGPCKKMKRSVYPSAEVAPYHDKFIWAYLDADAGKNRPLMKQFGVSGIPHISFISPGGEVVGQARGAVSPASFARTLSSTLAKVGGPAPVAAPATATSSGKPKKKGLFGIFKKKQ